MAASSPTTSQCTFWCSVLSDKERLITDEVNSVSQCTFWCSVLSDLHLSLLYQRSSFVSMHLLVLSAFRLSNASALNEGAASLNAPFGAQCFPTGELPDYLKEMSNVSMHLLVLSAFRLRDLGAFTCAYHCLNAPFGAQCFPTSTAAYSYWAVRPVSMHLLVLSAFRPSTKSLYGECLTWSQCTFWCSVLSDMKHFKYYDIIFGLNAPFGAQCFPTRLGGWARPRPRSQCTFWCSVLSDCVC